ncbi:HNH endonuclease [Kocuria sp. TGY1127_2]|uniref:HNH endonuclease n=1 Tax=Kocuria sp. TGY1127_2 TaxID=2711328 RepID=UPI0015C0F91F|nr:HNH endonuclease [Kocuria sp. TGY1127_2]
MAQHHGTCHICGKPGATEVDHKLAIALGGAKTDLNNLAPIHETPCHTEKTKRELAILRRLSNARKSNPSDGRI